MRARVEEFFGWVRAHWIALILALHAGKMAFWLHDVKLATGLPLANVDYIQFYGRALRIHEFLSRSGRIWGYDPFDMAGYLSGPYLEVGSHLMAITAHLLSGFVPIAATMLFLEIVGLVFGPLILVPAARLFGATKEQAWTSFAIATILTGSIEQFSTDMFKIGLWGWMMSSYLALFQVGCFWRWLEAPSLRRWIGFTAASMLVLQVHPSSFIVIIAPNVALYAIRFRNLPLHRHLEVAATAALVLLTNWYWVSPFLAFSKWRVTAPYYDTAGLMDLWHRFGPLQPDFYHSARAVIHACILALAVRGIRRLWTRSPDLGRVIVVWTVALSVVCYFGSSLPWIRTLQPGRNEFPLWLVLYLCAGFSVAGDVLRSPRRRRIAALLALVSVAYIFELIPGESPWSRFASPLRTQLFQWQTDAIVFLQQEKPRGSRVLLECGDDLQPNFADVVPQLTGAILIGGQHPGNFLAARSTLFQGSHIVFQGDLSEEPMAFDKILRNMSEDELAAYLRLYNVGFVIVRSPQMAEVLAQFPNVLFLAREMPPLRIYRTVEPPPGWFLEGSGDAKFDFDRIVINDASPGRLVLRAHWMSTLKASPAVTLSPIYEMDDPVPFIAIDNEAGYKRIEIYNGGLPPLWDRIRGKFKDDWGNR